MKRVVWILVLVLWLSILASSLGARVEADDYCYAGVVSSIGIIGSVHHWYYSWYGLYSDQVISSVLAALEPYGARFGISLMLLAVVLAFWYALSVWYRRTDALLIALAFAAALIMARPNDEPVYWVSAATGYWLIFAGPALLIGALARRRTLLAMLVAFVFIALTEAGSILIIAGLSFALLLWKGHRRPIALVWLAACFGFLIVFLAPGNAVRRAAIGPLDYSLHTAVAVILSSFATNFLLSLLVSIIPGLFLSGVGASLPPTFPVRRLPLFFLLLVIGGSLTLACVAFVSTGWSLPPRTIYILTPLWLGLWFMLGAIIGQHFPYWSLVAIGTSLALVVSAGQHTVQRLAYGQRWDARHAAIIANYRVQGNIGDWDTLTDTDWGLACAQNWYGHPIRFVDDGNVP